MSAAPPERVLRIDEGRFARLEAIEWWDQARVAGAKVLVIGAGALGNEVIKNLALLGVGHLIVVDMDRVELSNLCRSVLFREKDEGRFKAVCAVEAARAIHPAIQARCIVGNVLADVGLGWFRWADVVIGALDNREARVFVNSACARVGRPWVDGGIEVLQGVVRGFAPPATACYECTMSETDWSLLNKRRSCSLLARRALAGDGTPTTPTTASVIGALQVQETIKSLHGREALMGSGFVFDGAQHTSYRINYPIHPDCPWHEEASPIEAFPQFNSGSRLETVMAEAARRLDGLDALDLSRELVERVDCASCGARREVFRAAEHVTPDQLLCAACGTEGVPTFMHSLAADSPLGGRTPGDLGLPRRDILWARCGLKALGIEITGDPFPGDEAARPNPPSERQS